jgi:hypothetical protein
MADIELKVRVAADGTMKLVAKDMEKLGASTKKAADAQGEYNYRLNQGVTGASSAARSFSKMNQTIGSGPNGLVGAYATLAANAFAVSAAFNALRAAAQVEQMMKGLETQGARTGKSLVNVSNSLQEITKFSLSAADAMQATALMTSAGFNTKGMEDLTRVAYDASLALGRNVPDSLDRISKGVTKLEPELLDELGIMTKLSEAQSMYALANNKSVTSLTSFEKRQAMLNAVVAEGTAKFGGLADQVDANPYDKLGATFVNLTNNVLGVFNSILGPLASIFSGSQGMLFGGMLLFVSTIKKQLLPVLFDMGKRATAAAEEHLKEAAAIKDKTKSILDQAKAERVLAMETSRKKVGTIAGAAAPKKLRSKEIQEGSLTSADLKTELDRLDASIKARNRFLKDMEEGSTKKQSKVVELELIKAERKNLQELIDLELKGDADIKPLRKDARKSRLEYISLQSASAMEVKKASAIELASAGKLKESWKAASEAAKEYKKSLAAIGRAERVNESGDIIDQGMFSKASEFIKGKLGSMGIFAQTAAAGFMKFLPVIGIATTALSTAYSVYENYFQTDAEKARIKALEELRVTLENTGKSVEELNRINEASIPIGLKAAQSLIIQSNATTEIANSFKAVEDAANAAANNVKTDSFWKAMIGSPDDAVSYATGIAKDATLFKPISDEFKNSTGPLLGVALGAGIGAAAGAFLGGLTGPLAPVLIPAFGTLGTVLGADLGYKVGIAFAKYLPEEINGIDEGKVEGLKAIEQLGNIIGKDLAESMKAAAGGLDALAKSPALRAEFIKQAAQAYVGVADAVKELQDGLKKTGDALSQFFKAAVPTTPFDSLVSGYTSVTKALSILDNTIGGSDLRKQVEILSSMPEEMSRMLTLPNQQLLQTIQKQSAELNNNRTQVQELVKLGDKLNNAQRAQLSELQKKTPLLEKDLQYSVDEGKSIKENLISQQKSLAANQRDSIEYANKLKLINAVASANADVYSQTAVGEAARIEKQNQSVELQQAQIQIQLTMTDAYLTQNRALITQLELQQKLLGVTSKMKTEALQSSKVEAEKVKFTAGTKATAANVDTAVLANIDSIIAKQVLDAQKTNNMNLITGAVIKGTSKEQIQAANMYNRAAREFALAEFKAANAVAIDDTKAAVLGLESSVNSLKTELAALDTGKITDAEARALIAKKSLEVSQAMEVKSREIRSVNDEILESSRQISALEELRPTSLSRTLELKQREADRASRSIMEQGADEVALFRAEQNRIKSALASRKGLSTLDKEAYQESINLIDKQIKQSEELTAAGIRRVEITTKQQILEILIGEGMQGALNKLQESISLKQKQLDLTTEIANQEMQISRNAAEINVLRSGGEMDDRTSKRLDAEAAQVALRAAKEQYNLRLEVIDVEYKLLEAQRAQTLADLTIQEKLLRDAGKIPLADVIGKARSNLEQVDMSAMRELQTRQAQNVVTLAKQTAQRTAEVFKNTLRPSNFAESSFANFGARVESRKREELPDTTTTLQTGAKIDDQLYTFVDTLTVRLDELRSVMPMTFMEIGDAIGTAMNVTMEQFNKLSSEMSEKLGQDFGPQGKVFSSLTGLISTFSVTIPNALKTLGTDYATWAKENKDLVAKVGADTAQTIHQAQQLGAAFSAAAAIISNIASLIKSISDAKIAGVDKEIAAEQKRDGKSAESVTKLAALEKKKDDMARKSFNVQKKLMIAQAVMSTAAAVAGTLASMSMVALPPIPAIVAGLVGAMGAAQIAIISGMQYGGGGAKSAAATPSTLSIGKRSDSIDLARGPSANAGGEVGFLRGSQGMGTNASNFRTIGSAYGGELMRGYGNRGFVVGEKGPEVITPETPINVTPANDVMGSAPVNATINIQALDASGVQDILVSQKGNIIKMLRDAANASGKGFLEDVNVNVYTRPNVNRL